MAAYLGNTLQFVADQLWLTKRIREEEEEEGLQEKTMRSKLREYTCTESTEQCCQSVHVPDLMSAALQ